DWRIHHGMIEDHEGAFWFGTSQGLYVFETPARLDEISRRAARDVLTTRQGLAGNDVAALFEDSRGDVFIGTFAPRDTPVTVWRRRTQRLEALGAAQGFPFASVSAFAEDPAGNVWIAFRGGGLGRYTTNGFRLLGASSGPPSRPVSSLLVDREGRLWG